MKYFKIFIFQIFILSSFSDSRDKPSDNDLDSKMKGIKHGIKHFIILTGHPTNQIEF